MGTAFVLSSSTGEHDAVASPRIARQSAPTTSSPPPTEAPTTTAAPTAASTMPPTSTAPPATQPARRPAPSAPRTLPLATGVASTVEPYRGLGTWLDVYDWSATYSNGKPGAGVADVDRMADLGVQTLYLQASKHDAPTDVLEPELQGAIIQRAHDRGMAVVSWYLPTFVDPARDLQRLVAIAALPVEGIAVDIESRDVADVNERNRRLVELSQALRRALPGRAIGGIVLPPVVLEVVNPAFWPGFPYREIASSYDVWMTMGYWTNRKAGSGYRDAYRYTLENVQRLRTNLGQADVAVHPIGGIGDETSPADVDSFRRAAGETASIGGSLYDWRTTRHDAWAPLQAFRT